jgi:CRP/FNR family cyclic AMP-dependent transcriptional regulator
MRDDTPLLQVLAANQVLYTFEPGTIVFREGTPPNGVYVLLSGQVDLHFTGRNDDRALLFEESGTILGLSSLMSGRPQEYTATAVTSLITGFVDNETFFRVLNENPALWLNVLRILSRDISSCYDRVRELALV